jgi:hypothetical protein
LADPVNGVREDLAGKCHQRAFIRQLNAEQPNGWRESQEQSGHMYDKPTM